MYKSLIKSTVTGTPTFPEREHVTLDPLRT